MALTPTAAKEMCRQFRERGKNAIWKRQQSIIKTLARASDVAVVVTVLGRPVSSVGRGALEAASAASVPDRRQAKACSTVVPPTLTKGHAGRFRLRLTMPPIYAQTTFENVAAVIALGCCSVIRLTNQPLGASRCSAFQDIRCGGGRKDA